MNSEDSTLRKLVPENSSTRESVLQRIERRLEVLRDWLEDGIPSGKSFPRSLTQARVWQDDDLHINRIVSPNEFTTTHPLHGNSIREIGDLLTALEERFDRPVGMPSKQSKAVAEKYDRKAYDRLLEASIAQWQTQRDKHLHEKKRADSAEARSILLLEENAHKDEQIADLHRRLAIHEGLRTVK